MRQKDLARMSLKYCSIVILLNCLFGVLDIAASDELDHPNFRLPSKPSAIVSELEVNSWLVQSLDKKEFTIDSLESLEVAPGDAIEVRVVIEGNPRTRMLPEIVCLDLYGLEIPVSSSLKQASYHFPTKPLEYIRVFPLQPGTAEVRARLRADGKGRTHVSDLKLRRTQVDPYQTGSLIKTLHPVLRGGVVLESNLYLVDTAHCSELDQDGDGKWAVISQDLDALTSPKERGNDWWEKFEVNPNEIFWSDGVVLKSDTVHQDRDPDRSRALHFQATVRPGPYQVFLNNPGRAVAISTDGDNWKKYLGGSEIKLAAKIVGDSGLNIWIDACYRDKITAGPCYFDYVRLIPSMNAPSVDKFYAAALNNTSPATGEQVNHRDIEITVESPLFQAAANWPVRCGLPIPRGELLNSKNVIVTDAKGQERPCQCRVTAKWPDGSARWIYLDFMHDARSGNDKQFTASYGTSITRSKPLQEVLLKETEQGIWVDTGVIRFFVSREGFRLFENVSTASGGLIQSAPLSAEITEASGKVWHATDLPIASLEIEQEGPLHTVVHVATKLSPSGKPSKGFYHRAKIHAYAGSPLVQIDYFTANSDSRSVEEISGSMASKVDVKSFSLRLKPDASLIEVRHPYGVSSSKGSLIQKSKDEVIASQGITAKSPSPGWLATRSDDHKTIFLGLESMREQFPKAFRWTNDELELSLWAQEGGLFEWIEGVGKTHKISIYYGADELVDGEILAWGPVLACASPDWYCASGAFGPQVASQQSAYPHVEATLIEHMQDSVIEGVGLGFENYGDHSSSGYVQGTRIWDNNEYDLPAGCFVHFARTGDRQALRLGLASALHYLDVDVIHYSSEHADWARAAHVHGHTRSGHHTADEPNFHHAGYVQGLILSDYFLGEEVGIEGAEGIADWVLRKQRPTVKSMERALGHPLMTLNDVFEATGKKQYLRGAAQYIDIALKWEHPERSGWLAPVTESPAYYSGSPFCGGLLSASIVKFNSWAQLPEIDEALERAALWLLTDAWSPPMTIVHKGGSPRHTQKNNSPRHISSHSRLIRHVYHYSHDPLFAAVPSRLMQRGFGSASAAKNFGTRATGLVYNYLPWLISMLTNERLQADDLVDLVVDSQQLYMPLGRTLPVSVLVVNHGNDLLRNVRLSFRTRQDFQVSPAVQEIEELKAGEERNIEFFLTTPSKINLTSQYNRQVYGHFSAEYVRDSQKGTAHSLLTIQLQKESGEE